MSGDQGYPRLTPPPSDLKSALCAMPNEEATTGGLDTDHDVPRILPEYQRRAIRIIMMVCPGPYVPHCMQDDYSKASSLAF